MIAHTQLESEGATPVPAIDPRGLTHLGQLADLTGQSIVNLAGFLDEVDGEASGQLETVDSVLAEAASLSDITSGMIADLGAVTEVNAQALATVESSVDVLRQSSDGSRQVAGWVGQLDTMLGSVEGTLDAVSQANRRIAEIAKQINILAVNARIEAARAGPMGRGFAVVAEAINELSRETSQAAADVTGSTGDLGGLISGLRDEARDMSTNAEAVLDQASTADDALVQISHHVTSASADTARLTDNAQAVGNAVTHLTPRFQSLAESLKATVRGVHEAHGRAEEIVDTSETAIQVAVQLGAVSADGPMIERVQDHAHQIADLFEAALASGRITRDALFSERYTPLPGTNPEQVMAPFTDFTDAILPALQEPLLGSDPRIIFCAAVDKNGYLPTHNAKFSHPQGSDVVWNTANCRNRRIFNDRVGLKAGRNTAPFLVQTYRRDMGGGTFILMKDISAPIFVGGQHWGGLRMGVKPATA